MLQEKILKSQILLLTGIGLAAVIVGMGIGRYLYPPTLVLYVQLNWLTVNQANFIGFINFAGYLLGTFMASFLVPKVSTKPVWIVTNMVICACSLIACSFNLGVAWFYLWRFIAGINCAILIITAPSFVLQKIPGQYIGRVSSSIFIGTSLGITLSGAVTSIAHNYGLPKIWQLFGVFSLIASVFVFFAIRKFEQVDASNLNRKELKLIEKIVYDKKLVILLALSYAFCGAGFVPYSLYIGSYLSHLGFPVGFIGHMWFVFGLGGVMGAFINGYLGDKIGVEIALLIIIIISFITMILTVTYSSSVLFLCYTLAMGISFPSIVSLTSATVKIISNNHHIIWSRVTLCFAIGQLLSSYAASQFLVHIANFRVIFLSGAVLFSLAAICVCTIVLKNHSCQRSLILS